MVIRAQSGFFTVQTSQGNIICKVPKRLKYRQAKNQKTQDVLNSALVAVGDSVTLLVGEDNTTGMIASVEPRKRVLSRARPAAQARNMLQDREQIWVSNPDQVIFVFAIKNPAPSLRKLDRFLVVSERNQLPAIICINKIDLATCEEAQALFQCYTEIGYPVICTSASQGDGIAELRDLLRDKISVLAGSSGVGKSSLLNAVQPGLGLKVGAVSDATTKGKHTTRYTELLELEFGGYIADTPGIRGLALFDIEADELDAYFREISPLVAQCGFSDCQHRHEPNCAVIAAVKAGQVSAERYDSYLRLREEHEHLNRTAY